MDKNDTEMQNHALHVDWTRGLVCWAFAAWSLHCTELQQWVLFQQLSWHPCGKYVQSDARRFKRRCAVISHYRLHWFHLHARLAHNFTAWVNGVAMPDSQLNSASLNDTISYRYI